MRLILFFTFCVGLCNCSQHSRTSSLNETPDGSATTTRDARYLTQMADTTSLGYDSLFKLERYLTKNKMENEKYEMVDYDCAILIYPTSEQIEEMKKKEGEDFYIGADDSNWYQGQAISMIDSIAIKKITATGQFLRLKGKQKTWDLDIRKKNLPKWNLIFFKTNKEPKIVSTVDLTIEKVKEYFNK